MTINNHRNYWITILEKISNPVLTNLANRELKTQMPIETMEGIERSHVTHLEAFGRLLAGIAPWLELNELQGKEGQLRRNYAELAREAIDAATDSHSPDYMNFTQGNQTVVDSSFLAQALLRSPQELWHKLSGKVQSNVISSLKQTRRVKPLFNNWLLFSAIIEAFFDSIGEQSDYMRIDYALKQHEQWYKGDGAYGDGPEFHWDYYNSFVIHPMLIDIISVVGSQRKDWEKLQKPILLRSKRYAAVLERMISPEGTIPTIGRSLAYRFGSLQSLGQMALLKELPDNLLPAQVRCGMTAVLNRMMEMPGTFDEKGWLTIGFCGHQPNLGERYISTGSLYGCSWGLLPLGLHPEEPFWRNPAQDWTAKKIWDGEDLECDKSLHLPSF